MKLYNYTLKRSLLFKDGLIISVDLNEFNNVDIHIDCDDLIEYFMSLMDSKLFNTKLIQNRIEIFLEENYCSEVDPYYRGEN